MSPTGKSFRFVRAGVRAVWLPSGIGYQIPLVGLFPFPFWPGLVVGLFLFGPGWARGAFPFPFWARGAFPFPFPHPPNLLSTFNWAYRYIYLYTLSALSYCGCLAACAQSRPEKISSRIGAAHAPVRFSTSRLIQTLGKPQVVTSADSIAFPFPKGGGEKVQSTNFKSQNFVLFRRFPTWEPLPVLESPSAAQTL